MLSFIEYCHSKSINATSFKEKEEKLYQDLEFYFDQVHPDSFTAQKLFLINEIRRRHHFIKPEKVKVAKKTSVQKATGKPIVGIKPKAPAVKVGIMKPTIDKVEGKEMKKTSVIKPKISKPVISIAKKDTSLRDVKSEKVNENMPSALKPKIVIPKKSAGALKPKIPVQSKKSDVSIAKVSEEEGTEEIKKEKSSVLKPKIAIAKKSVGALRPKIPIQSKKSDVSITKVSEEEGTEEIKKDKSSVLKPKIVIPKKSSNVLKPKITTSAKKSMIPESTISKDNNDLNKEVEGQKKKPVLKPKIPKK